MTQPAEQNPDILFKDKQEYIKKHGISIFPDKCAIVEVNDRKGFHCRGTIPADLVFDEIIKISYRHFLCMDQDQAAVCRFSDIGYENVHGASPMECMLTFQTTARPDLTTLLTRVSRDFPEAFDDISALIQPSDENRHISEFNHFSAFVDDVHFTWAVQRVSLDNTYQTTELDLRYGALACS